MLPSGIQALLPLKSPKNLAHSMLLLLILINFYTLICMPHYRLELNTPVSFILYFLGIEFALKCHILNSSY